MRMNPKYWGTAGAGILPLCVKTGRVMLALRSSQVMEPGTWALFGGKIEPGEAPEEAAVREFREETFYNGGFDLVQLFTFRDRESGFSYYNFLGLFKKEFSESAVEESWEADAARWMTLQQALKIRPKHFGLKALFADRESLEIIMSYAMTRNPEEDSYEIGDVRLWKYDSIGGFDIWVVNGSLIRSLKEIEFTIGGHHWRYPFIPRTQLWIEDTRDPIDLYANAMHEVIEATLMRDQGLDYDSAHEIASRRETEIRKSLF